MSIKEVMNLGTKGMNAAQKQEEQERRLKVVDRINLLAARIDGCKAELRKLAKGSKESKLLNGKVRGWERELGRIKGDESVWLKTAGWFMY